jgi:acetyl esterase/lipase
MTTGIRIARHATLALVAVFGYALTAPAEPVASIASEPAAKYTRSEDVVYGRRDGHAMTLDVFTPPGRANGAGVIIFVSAEYRSNRDLLAMIHPIGTKPFLDRGYVVFAVLLSSQPKYTVPEILDDAHRAVRFVKHNGKKFGVDPAKIGVTGGSAGGHLALMMGSAGAPGDPKAVDPVDRGSSKAAAVACFFPPTDFTALDGKCTPELAAPFDIRTFEPTTGTYERVTPAKRREIGTAISPLTHAAKGSAPTLIIHGDRDTLVPLSQSTAMIDKLEACGVECKLVVKEGKGHFWLGIDRDVPALVDWFERHLLGRNPQGSEIVRSVRR